MLHFHSNSRPAPKSRLHRQRGATSLVEISIAAAITLLALIVGVPQVKGYYLETRIGPVSDELKRFITRARILGESSSTTPFASITTADNLVPSLRDSTILKVTGNTVAHSLGGDGTGSNGVVTLEPASISGGANGSAFKLTLTNVNDRACPTLATILNAVVDEMGVNGTTVKTPKADGGPGAFNPATAEQLCTPGDTNTFVFAAR